MSGQCRDGQGLVAVLLVDAKKPDRRCGRSACRWQPERPRAYDLGTAARSRPTDPADLIVRLLIFITVVLRRIRQVDPQMRVMRNGPVGLIWRNANAAQQSSLQDCCAMTTAKRNRTFRARPTQAVQQQARSPARTGGNQCPVQASRTKKNECPSEYQQGMSSRVKVAQHLHEIPSSARLPVSRVSHLPLPESQSERAPSAFPRSSMQAVEGHSHSWTPSC